MADTSAALDAPRYNSLELTAAWLLRGLRLLFCCPCPCPCPSDEDEDVLVSTTGEGLPVEVDVVEELGADGYLYGHTEIDGSRVDIVARVDGRSHPSAGDKVFILPEPHHVHAFDTESGLRLTKKAVTAG